MTQCDYDQHEFFVSVKDGPKTGILLGPYATHEEAKANVGRGTKLAKEATPWAAFYAFGTCSAPAGYIKKTVFGS